MYENITVTMELFQLRDDKAGKGTKVPTILTHLYICAIL
jgi:hypothetical protein